jgi:hypothetical protein
LEDKLAGTVPEEGTDPVYHVGAYALLAEEGEESRAYDVVKPALNVEEEGRYFVPEAEEGLNMVLERQGRIGGGTAWETATLHRVDQVTYKCLCREAGSHDPFQDFRKCAEEDNHSK